jgi:hypothetical protein
MDRQPQLHDILVELIGEDGHVYFQPPASLAMEYPCIRYERSTARSSFAGNKPYRYTEKYTLTVIAQDPNSDIRLKVAALEMCIHNRWFAVAQLNHDVFELYF